MFSTFAAASLLSALAVSAVPCVQFDSSWNLYAFGGSSDVKIGANTTWSSPSTTTLSTSGRPTWSGNNSQCLFSQTNNAMYVVGADTDLSTLYIYNFASDSWSTQTTSGVPADLGNSRSASVLDHDTNVIYTLTTGSGMYQLDLSSVTTSASSSAVAWEAVENSSFSVDGYTVTATQAANHIFFFGVPGTAAGSADVFVVHYAYFQPTAQAFNGTAFPDTAGQAFSVPSDSNNVPYSMIFVPNDFSDTYVVTHWTDLSDYTVTSDAPFATSLINSTQTLAAPTSQDSTAAYAASPYALVQIDAAGDIYYMSNPINSDYTVSSSATWSKLSYTLAGTGGTVSSTNSTSSAASSSSSAASGTSAAASTGQTSSAASGSSSASTTSASTSASASSTTSSAEKVAGGRMDLAGLALGFVALGMATLL